MGSISTPPGAKRRGRPAAPRAQLTGAVLVEVENLSDRRGAACPELLAFVKALARDLARLDDGAASEGGSEFAQTQGAAPPPRTDSGKRGK